MMAINHPDCLIADVGGTYTRLALVDATGNTGNLQLLENDDYPELADALDSYIRSLPPEHKPDAAIIAVAGPVTGDSVRITNRNWAFSAEAYRTRFGLQFLHVVNDFAAVALAISTLEPTDYLDIGGGTAVADKPVGIVGPGTGLGVSFLIPQAGRWIPVSSEGGHVTLAAADEQEEKLIAFVREQYGHVSAERLLSGPGLSLIYQVIGRLQGKTMPALTPNEILVRDEQHNDAIATQAIDLFLQMLGTVAANLAVTIAAEGGIYFAGGILPRIRQRMLNSGFRKRFITHDRYSAWLDRIPTRLIIRDHIALTGLRNYLAQLNN